MTEESDDSSDSNTIIEHKLPWQSESKLLHASVQYPIPTSMHIGLNQYMMLLEDRLHEKVQKECVGIVAKKVRSPGTPSSSSPPVGAPSWAVKKDTRG